MRTSRITGRAAASVAAVLAVVFGSAGVASAASGASSAVVSHGASSVRERPAATGATLTDASITFFTLDDNKDSDTLLSVQVLDSGNKVAASATGFFGQFGDGTTHPITLKVRPGVTWDALQAGHLRLNIQPHGDDTWKFGYELDLNFSDGDFAPTIESRLSLSEDNKTFLDPLQF
ncbi:hypothetical protein ACIHAA_23760 [Streptomyces sp. NPDC052040]|uniref:hypothetical protein n=1 Tax=unclassified Streptomyces TaxID=2593676 RepID=UPI0037CDDFAF